MAVNYTPPTAESLLPVPGIRLGTAAARIKNWERDDIVLIEAAPGTVAAGVFTQNAFAAAPVKVCRAHLAAQHAQSLDLRALVINAGNANAGTGDAGVAAAEATCVRAAQLADCAPSQVLPFSTGVIMEPLPVDRVVDGIGKAHTTLREDGWFAAARAIMTTDTVPKGASRRIDVHGFPVTVTGIAKGAGMIHPDMATMLAFIATDAPIAFPVLQTLVRDVADVSFNRASVDGDTSTNDSFVLAATAKAGIASILDPHDPRLGAIRQAIGATANSSSASQRSRCACVRATTKAISRVR